MCPVIYTIAYRRSRKAPDGLNLPPEIKSKIMQAASKPARRHYGNSNKEQLLKYEQDYVRFPLKILLQYCINLVYSDGFHDERPLLGEWDGRCSDLARAR